MQPGEGARLSLSKLGAWEHREGMRMTDKKDTPTIGKTQGVVS